MPISLRTEINALLDKAANIKKHIQALAAQLAAIQSKAARLAAPTERRKPTRKIKQ